MALLDWIIISSIFLLIVSFSICIYCAFFRNEGLRRKSNSPPALIPHAHAESIDFHSRLSLQESSLETSFSVSPNSSPDVSPGNNHTLPVSRL